MSYGLSDELSNAHTLTQKLTAERDAQRKAADHWMGEANDEHNENVRLREQVRMLREALEIYANPDFYFACSFFFDRPTGGFDEDFDYDEQYERDMPGKIARAALAATKEKP